MVLVQYVLLNSLDVLHALMDQSVLKENVLHATQTDSITVELQLLFHVQLAEVDVKLVLLQDALYANPMHIIQLPLLL